MKLSAILILFFTVHVCASGWSQKITLDFKNAPLEKVFREITRQSGYLFMYNDRTLENALPVTLKTKDENLESVLQLCFANQPLSYQIEDRTVIVSERTVKRVYSISGVVANMSDVPLEGVTVTIKETGQGTLTNIKGFFSLDNIPQSGTVIFSSVGYKVFETPIIAEKSYKIQLEASYKGLDEMIVKGYYKTSRRSNSGSVSKVNAETISQQPVTNLAAALQGRMTGAFISTESGIPGGNINITIRGKNSIAAGNQPLILLNGIPFPAGPFNENLANFMPVGTSTSPLNSINPADIESVEILKDAEATSIYGARGANGVILITTRKAVAAKTTLLVNVASGFSRSANTMKLLNLENYLMLRKEAYRNDNTTPDPTNAPDLFVWNQQQSTNWQEKAIGNTATIKDIQASFNGGNANTNFMISGNFHDEGTVIGSATGYKRGGIYSNLNHRSSNNKFEFNFNSGINSDRSQLIRSSLTTILFLAPNFPLLNGSGNLNFNGGNNLLALLKQRIKSTTQNILFDGSLRYNLFRGLWIRANIGYSYLTMDQVTRVPKSSIDPNTGSNPVNTSYFGNNKNRNYIVEPQLDYQWSKDKHKVNLIAGGSYQSSNKYQEFIEAANYNSEDLMESIGAAGNIAAKSDILSEYKYASAYGKISYTYRQLLTVNGTFRRDGSSKFGKGKQFGNFPAGAISWIFSDLNFFRQHSKFLSFGKLRASYGVTGNDQIPDYLYLASYGPGNVYNNEPSLVPLRVANPDYSWETTKKLELAIETGFLKDRVLASLNWYHNKSSNQLVSYPLPAQAGFSSYQANFPATVENKGVEIELSADVISSTKFKWNSSFNMSFQKNRLVSFPEIEKTPYNGLLTVGYSLNTLRGWRFTGIDNTNGIPQFEDVDKNGSLSYPEDFLPMKDMNPLYFGGFNNTFTYGKWQLGFFLQFTKQYGKGLMILPGNSNSNTSDKALQRWQHPGDETTMLRATTTPGDPAYEASNLLSSSDAGIYDVSYVRLKTCFISWNSSPEINRWLRIKDARVYVEAQNLLTFTPYENGLDPETLISGLPPLKTIMAGIKVSF